MQSTKSRVFSQYLRTEFGTANNTDIELIDSMCTFYNNNSLDPLPFLISFKK